MKFILSLVSTILLILILDKSWVIFGSRIPPLGKFLDPIHGFWQNAEPDGHIGPNDQRLMGLRSKVTIIYDSLLIPHIFAKNEEDLYMAQGYVTAMNRLWQMEFQTHAAAGRLSSILGPGEGDALLNYDRNQRRLGIPFAAENAINMMMKDPIMKKMIEKYTDGVNRYINSLTYKDLPLEYKLMDYRPEPWTPLKCGLLLKSMCQTLNMSDKDIEMTNTLYLYGKELVDLLYPDRESALDPIVDNAGNWNFSPVDLDDVPSAIPDELIEITRLNHSNPDLGSNNWAVSGSKTATGAPLLCNDPHMSTSLPSIWYAVHLNGPGVNVMGVTIPGAPGVLIGHNDSIAWGITNAQRDLVDWYRITYRDKAKSEYLLDSAWVKTEKVVEEIKVRDEEVFYDTVVYTHWGPIPYDENFRAGNNANGYAFRWLAHDPSKEITTFYKLNRARNYADYMDALDHYASPAQNFVFASVSGDIAMRIQGKFPVRRKNEGKFVIDGSNSEHGWQAFIPLRQNVTIKNPDRGFVSSANQYPVDDTYPYYITARSYQTYRNRRINDMLRQLKSITPEDMMMLQNDNFNLQASESLPFLLNNLAFDTTRYTSLMLDSSQHARAMLKGYQVLSSWNYVNNKDSDGASYYEAWWDRLMPLLWDEMSGQPLPLITPSRFNTIKLLTENPQAMAQFVDNQSTVQREDLRSILMESFVAAVQDIEAWKAAKKRNDVPWAEFKDTEIRHLARLEALSLHVRHGGNEDIVNASSRYHGPAWRMVVSLERTGIKAYGVYPGGQSGNPGSAHYDDMVDHWANGKYFPFAFPRDIEQAMPHAFFSTTLNPREK